MHDGMGPWLLGLVVTTTAAMTSGPAPMTTPEAPAACDTARLRAQVHALGGDDPALAALVDTLTVTSTTGGGLVATLVHGGDDTRPARRRTLRAAECSTLGRAVALVAASWVREAAPTTAAIAAIDPQAERPSARGVDEALPRAAGVDDGALRRGAGGPAAGSGAPPLEVRTSLLGAAYAGVGPGLGGGVGLAVDVARGPWLVRAVLEAGRGEGLTLPGGAQVDFFTPTTRTSACVVALGDGEGLALRACAQAALTLVFASLAATEVEGMAPWLGLGGSLRADARAGWLLLSADVGALGAVARSTMRLADGTPVYTPGAFTPFLTLGLGLALP